MSRHRSDRRRSCALVSGGVESAALVTHLLARGDRVFPVYVRSGYRWEATELSSLRRLLRALAAPRLEAVAVLRVHARELAGPTHWAVTGKAVPGARSADEAVYLPGRNLLLAACAAVYAARRGVERLALGPLCGNPFPDATPAFFASLARTLSLGLGKPFRIETPFRALTKAEVVRRAGRLPWELTFSCIAPSRGHACGRCNKCAERRKVLGRR